MFKGFKFAYFLKFDAEKYKCAFLIQKAIVSALLENLIKDIPSLDKRPCVSYNDSN